MEANIQPLNIHCDFSSAGLRSHICMKAADSGRSSGEDLRQARTLMNRELPNLTVLPTGMSKVCVRAESLSIVRMTMVDVSSVLRAQDGAAARHRAREKAAQA